MLSSQSAMYDFPSRCRLLQHFSCANHPRTMRYTIISVLMNIKGTVCRSASVLTGMHRSRVRVVQATGLLEGQTYSASGFVLRKQG